MVSPNRRLIALGGALLGLAAILVFAGRQFSALQTVTEPQASLGASVVPNGSVLSFQVLDQRVGVLRGRPCILVSLLVGRAITPDALRDAMWKSAADARAAFPQVRSVAVLVYTSVEDQRLNRPPYRTVNFSQ